MNWTRGEQRVDGLLAEGRLVEPVTRRPRTLGRGSSGARPCWSPRKRENDANAEAAYVLAYDAARKAPNKDRDWVSARYVVSRYAGQLPNLVMSCVIVET